MPNSIDVNPAGLRTVADNVDRIADAQQHAGHHKQAQAYRENAAFLRWQADQLVNLETIMGRVADDIAKLKADQKQKLEAETKRADDAEKKWNDAVAEGRVNDDTDVQSLTDLEAELSGTTPTS